ncbi:MAG TPA: YigZ family protein [Paracoccus sp. (in: a-proteobacteria)]|nr:YigZ family protein [Paracoccus sp. (in: a-proteobacteria)]
MSRSTAPQLAVFDRIISDRGSVYAVSGAPVSNRASVVAALARLKSEKRFAKATHNSWAARLGGEGARNDDGESGASAIILRMMETEGLDDHMIVVTRWYGGKHLGGDRFRHVIAAVRHYLANRPR